MKKLTLMAILAMMMFLAGVAQATPIVISNWQFTWGGNQFEDGIGWVWDMDATIAPFQVKYTKTSLSDPLGGITDWISPLSYAEGGSYTFVPIHLDAILDGVYYTSLGKGEWFSGGDNPFNDGVTFSGVGLEITQISAVPEPPPFILLAAGFVAIGLTGQRRKMSRQH